MSKRNSHSAQFRPSKRDPIQVREAPPLPFPNKDGAIELHCPFCPDHHLLDPRAESTCGTRVEVMAIQEVITEKMVLAEGLTCLKCHKGGGGMVRYNKGFIHLKECSPGTMYLHEEPNYKVFAKFVYHLPEKIRGLVERYTGKAKCVEDMDKDGNKTGKVLGYFFWKGTKNANSA